MEPRGTGDQTVLVKGKPEILDHSNFYGDFKLEGEFAFQNEIYCGNLTVYRRQFYKRFLNSLMLN